MEQFVGDTEEFVALRTRFCGELSDIDGAS
jgi:hypothetical protein